MMAVAVPADIKVCHDCERPLPSRQFPKASNICHECGSRRLRGLQGKRSFSPPATTSAPAKTTVVVQPAPDPPRDSEPDIDDDERRKYAEREERIQSILTEQTDRQIIELVLRIALKQDDTIKHLNQRLEDLQEKIISLSDNRPIKSDYFNRVIALKAEIARNGPMTFHQVRLFMGISKQAMTTLGKKLAEEPDLQITGNRSKRVHLKKVKVQVPK